MNERNSALPKCPGCGGRQWADDAADLFIRDAVKCRACGREYRRPDLLARAERLAARNQRTNGQAETGGAL